MHDFIRKQAYHHLRGCMLAFETMHAPNWNHATSQLIPCNLSNENNFQTPIARTCTYNNLISVPGSAWYSTTLPERYPTCQLAGNPTTGSAKLPVRMPVHISTV